MRTAVLAIAILSSAWVVAAPSDPPPPPESKNVCVRLFERIIRTPLDRALFWGPRLHEERVARLPARRREIRAKRPLARAIDAAVFMVEPFRLTVFPDRRPSFPPDEWLREYYAEADVFARDVIAAAGTVDVMLTPSRRAIAYTPHGALKGGGILFFFDRGGRATMRTPLGDLEISPTPVIRAGDRDAIVRELESSHLLGIAKPGRDIERDLTVYAPNHNAWMEEFPEPRLRDHDDPLFEILSVPGVWDRVKPADRDTVTTWP